MAHRTRSTLVAAGILVACFGGATLGNALVAGATAPRIAAADVAASPSTIPPNSVQVTGSGDVNVTPNVATVTFGVLVNRDNAADAQSAANAVIAAALHNLHALGIPDRHIQTQDISLQPRFDNSGNVIIGYQASQTLAVQVYTLRTVGSVVDAGVNAHANNNVSISYGLSDPNKAQTEALTLAVQHARARALAAAAAVGRSLAGAHVQVSQSSEAQPQPVTAQFSAVRAPSAAPASPPTQALGGMLDVHEDVTLTYTF